MKQREDYGHFDYVIVGAGTAGCALANRLSADPRHRVLLVEAGGSDNYIWTKIPVGCACSLHRAPASAARVATRHEEQCRVQGVAGRRSEF